MPLFQQYKAEDCSEDLEIIYHITTIVTDKIIFLKRLSQNKLTFSNESSFILMIDVLPLFEVYIETKRTPNFKNLVSVSIGFKLPFLNFQIGPGIRMDAQVFEKIHIQK
jgi:hypothetical protein